MIRDVEQLESLIGLHTDQEDVFLERFQSRGKLYTVTNENLLVALKRLPAKELEIIVLVFWEEMLQREIADLLHIPVRTVYARKKRALAKLRLAGFMRKEEKNKRTWADRPNSSLT